MSGSAPQSLNERIDSFDRLENLLIVSVPLLPTQLEIFTIPISMTVDIILQNIRALSIHLQLDLDHLLLRASLGPSDQTSRLTTRLSKTLGQIISLVAHLPGISDYIHHAYAFQLDVYLEGEGLQKSFLWFPDLEPRGLKPIPKERDTALAILYAFAQLLKGMLEPEIGYEDKSTDAVRSAVAMCRLCASFPTPSGLMATLLVKRTLFWAGMVFTESRCLAGDLQ